MDLTAFVDVLKESLDIMLTTKLPVSLLELALFVIINSLCILFGRHRLGLIVSYLFVMYWGFVANFDFLYKILEGLSLGLPLYIGVGAVMVLLLILAFFIEDK